MLLRAWLVVLSVALVTAPGRAFAQSDTTEPPGVADRQTQPAPVAHQVVAPESSFIETLGGDFRRLFSTDNARVGLVFGSAALAAAHWDVPTTREASQLSSGFSSGGNVAGALWTQLGAGVGALLVGKVSRQPGIASLGSDLLRAQLVSQTLVQGLKMATERRRPDASNRFSFPSGHTASAFATATVLERRFGWRIGVPAYALSSYVATARLASNKHYLSDVLIGAAIGVGVGRTVSIGSRSNHFDLGVTPVAGGAAVTVTKRN